MQTLKSSIRLAATVLAWISAMWMPAPAGAQDPPAAPDVAFEVLHTFIDEYGRPDSLMRGSGGVLYGTASGAGTFGRGVVFSLARDEGGRWTRTIVHSVGPDEYYPNGGLVQGTDGALYGIVSADSACGRIVKMMPDGAGFATVHAFDGEQEGCTPKGRLWVEADGLYGVTSASGADGGGTIFKLSYDGVLTTLHAFRWYDENGNMVEGGAPSIGVIRASDGNFYGATAWVLYRMSPAGQVDVVTWTWGPFETELVQAGDGLIYGTLAGQIYKDMAGDRTPVLPWSVCALPLTVGTDGAVYTGNPCGASGYGSLIRIDADGATTIHDFDGTDGAVLATGLVPTADGDLFGLTATAVASRGTLYRISSGGAFSTELQMGIGSDGHQPYGMLALGPGGQWYGTTSGGGQAGVGTVFRISRDGRLTTVHDFFQPASRLGVTVVPTGLLTASDGHLYGTTGQGGDTGFGSIHRLTSAGEFTQLYSFDGGQQGWLRPGWLVEPGDGELFGVAEKGFGAAEGSVFGMTTAGAFRRVAAVDGYVMSHAVAGRQGFIYGTAWSPTGSSVFRVGQDGSASILHRFSANNGEVVNGLTVGTDDALYGLTGKRIFRITASGEFQTIFSFDRDSTGTPWSRSPLIWGPDGRLYGTTFSAWNVPTVFQFDPTTGTYVRVWTFESRDWFVGMTFGPDGWIYGVSVSGGSGRAGMIFRLRPPGLDIEPPELALPSAFTAEAIAASGAVVSYEASATDAIDGPVTTICEPAPGSMFPFGSTTVSCVASDANDNTATGTFTVTVVDTTPPFVTVPVSVTAEAVGSTGTVATYDATAVDLVDGDVAVSCTPAFGATFPVGTTTVNCTSTDAHGNAASAGFPVIVTDTTPPVVTVPANIATEATGASGAVVTYTASASDLVDGALAATCTPASGATFAIGTTPVTCAATDTHGTTGSASFSVTVSDTTPPAISRVTPEPSVLWPPNGRMVPVVITVLDSDAGDAAPVCRITQVSSNQASPRRVNRADDDDRTPQWTITGDLTVNLLAARSGDERDRLYTIAVTCADKFGNSASKTAAVFVPHDKRDAKEKDRDAEEREKETKREKDRAASGRR